VSERERQRRLHVENRLEELAAKLGALEDEPTPEWLESLEGWYAWHARIYGEAPHRPVSPPPPPRPPNRPLEQSKAKPSDW
jgi:hypothetical protein